MTYEDLLPRLYEHGRITGMIAGERKQLWGVITEIENNYLNFIDHHSHFHIIALKDVRGFKVEALNTEYAEPKLKCDCGHKSKERFTCERCGKTFCGNCGHQKWIDLVNQDICANCLKVIIK
jgi:hypothetical protein